MDLLVEIGRDFAISFSLLGSFWWLYLPAALVYGFIRSWAFYTQERYLDSLDWVLLHVRPPTDVDRSPKGIEQFFAGLHGIFTSSLDWKDKFFGGEVPEWFSLEILGSDRGTNFFIRTLRSYRHLVESGLFAQYPGAEITEVSDYMDQWPKNLPNAEIDLFGSELLLAKEDPYPLRTYEYFEEKAQGPGLVKRIDPLSIVSETYSTLRPGEYFVIQLLISPTSHDWTKSGQALIEKVSGREGKAPAPDFLERTLSAVDNLFIAPAPPKKEEKREKRLAPHEEEIIKGISRKISKIGFQSSVRLVYLARKDVFHRYHFAAISGAFRQFADLHLNSFKTNKKSLTHSKGRFGLFFPSGYGFFTRQIVLEKKQKIYRDLRWRAMPKKTFILNTEELATIFHLPGWLDVQAPMLPRVEAKKGQPPVNLPME